MKKGQGTAALLYILGGVVMALAIYYGVSSVAQVKQEGTEAGLLLLESTIKTDIGRISSQYGSNRSINYNLGSDFTRICFADTTKKNLIKQDVSVPLIINDSVSAGSSNNVFLLGPKTEAFYGGEIRVCLKNVSCFNASRGVANVRMFGGGGFAMFDPCGPPVFSIPQVVNWTVAKEIKTEIYPPQLGLSPVNFPLVANATDPRGNGLVDFKWVIKNITSGSTVETPVYAISGGPYSSKIIDMASNRGPFIVYNYSEFYITLVVTNNVSQKGSFTFKRSVVEPGTHFPEARIIWLPSSPASFKGLMNDSSSGYLNYSWNWGDGNSVGPLPTGARAANQSVENDQIHPFAPSPVSRTVIFKVTNQLGYSATDTLVIMNNTAPWIDLIYPAEDAFLPSLNVNFRFVPHDNEQVNLSCQLLLDGSVIPINENLARDQENTTTVPNVALGEHHWAVTCSDGVASNTSETRKFTVVSLPLLRCEVSSICPSGEVAMLSISDKTNAHVSSNVGDYAYKLCCNLSNGGVLSPQASTSCSNPFITLSSSLGNAHAASKGDTTYLAGGTMVCFSSSKSGVSFDCSTKAACNENETCVLTLSSDLTNNVNSHAATCNSTQAYAYLYEICCNATSS